MGVLVVHNAHAVRPVSGAAAASTGTPTYKHRMYPGFELNARHSPSLPAYVTRTTADSALSFGRSKTDPTRSQWILAHCMALHKLSIGIPFVEELSVRVDPSLLVGLCCEFLFSSWSMFADHDSFPVLFAGYLHVTTRSPRAPARPTTLSALIVVTTMPSAILEANDAGHCDVRWSNVEGLQADSVRERRTTCAISRSLYRCV